METGNILRSRNTRTQNRNKRNNRVQRRRTSLNFEKFASEGNRFINDVADELHVSRNSAARITRAVLHAVRDRIPPDDAIQFAQGLPMALKAVFIDQYDISDTPVVMRHAESFLDYIYFNNQFTAIVDFPHENSVEEALRGVFNVLEDYMDMGQIDQIKKLMGKDIRKMIDGYGYAGETGNSLPRLHLRSFDADSLF